MSQITGHKPSLLYLLVFVLATSNLILGGLSAYFLYDNDNGYNLLFDRHVPVLAKNLRLVERTSALQRNVVNSHLLPDEQERLAAARKLPDLGSEVALLAHEVSAQLKEFGNQELGTALERQYAAYFDSLARCASLPPGRIVQLHEAPLSDSRAHLSNIHLIVEKSTTWLEQRVKTLSDEMTNRTQRKVTILGGLAAWPLLAVILLMALAVSLLSFFVVMNRDQGSANEP